MGAASREQVSMTGVPSTIWLPDGIDTQLEALIDLIGSWNRRINVVSRKLTREDLLRHALSSLAPLELLSDPAADVWMLDVGSGGGFPAFPLLLARPAWSAVLVEATRKKCLYLRDVGERLTPGRVRVLQGRYEGLSMPTAEAPEDPDRPGHQDRGSAPAEVPHPAGPESQAGAEPEAHTRAGARDRFDLITLRAVAPDGRFVSSAAPRLRRDLAPGGLLAWYTPQDDRGQVQALDALKAAGCVRVGLVRVEWAGATLAIGRGPQN
ncbi:MAG TPA: RsmG family class I SAM-dependent methyltransferase [Candidatus Saccharimonadales bacterium]|nr:RsmG family class I SAM-dependent methyltransferase [Candidatus Saccharimonadales bacterium]